MASRPAATPVRGHSPALRPVLGTHAEPLDADLLRRFDGAPATDVSDAVGRLYTASARLSPLYTPMRTIVGSALTVKTAPGDNWAVHAALRLVEPGDVLVVDWRGMVEACAGGASMLLPAIERGLVGVVVDGAWRDIDELADIDFPIVGAGTSPFSPSKSSFGEINVAVACGGVVVNPGDLVIADGDGAVFVPRNEMARVADHLADDHSTPVKQALSEDDLSAYPVLGDEYWENFDAEGGVRS